MLNLSNWTILNWSIILRGNLYYKMVQIFQSETTLLQSGASVTMDGVTKWGKHYDKVGQLRAITKQDKSYYKVRQPLLQSGAVTTK